MAIIGRARAKVDIWGDGNYVFVEDGKPLGSAVTVQGLDEALATRGTLPDVRVSGLDPALERWTTERMQAQAQGDFLIRDNRKGRWVKLKGAFVHKLFGSGDCVWCINGIEEIDSVHPEVPA